MQIIVITQTIYEQLDFSLKINSIDKDDMGDTILGEEFDGSLDSLN